MISKYIYIKICCVFFSGDGENCGQNNKGMKGATIKI